MGQPPQQPPAFPQQRYTPPPHPHQRYPQPIPQQPLPQQQVYLIPAVQPEPDKWRKRLLIINGVIACLVLLYFISQSPQPSVGSEAMKPDGKSDMSSEQVSLRYPAELAVGEYHKPIDRGERWTVYTQTQDPSSHVELSEYRDIRIVGAEQTNRFVADRSAVNNDLAGQTITPQPMKVAGRDAYSWSYYDSSRNSEIRNIWIPGSTMSHRVQCKILDAERARALQICEAAVNTLTVRSR